MRKALCAALILLLASGCSARRKEVQPLPAEAYEHREETAYVIQTEPVPIARQMEGQEGIVKLVVTDKGFEPPVLSTTVGGRVKLHLVNQGSRAHTLTIPRWGVITRNLEPGEENYIEFTAGEKGVFPFFSDAPGDPEPGIAGELKVE